MYLYVSKIIIIDIFSFFQKITFILRFMFTHTHTRSHTHTRTHYDIICGHSCFPSRAFSLCFKHKQN